MKKPDEKLKFFQSALLAYFSAGGEITGILEKIGDEGKILSLFKLSKSPKKLVRERAFREIEDLLNSFYQRVQEMMMISMDLGCKETIREDIRSIKRNSRNILAQPHLTLVTKEYSYRREEFSGKPSA